MRREQVTKPGVQGFFLRHAYAARIGQDPASPLLWSPWRAAAQCHSAGVPYSPQPGTAQLTPQLLCSLNTRQSSLAPETSRATRRAPLPAPPPPTPPHGLEQWLSNLNVQQKQFGLWGTNAHSRNLHTDSPTTTRRETVQHFPWHLYSCSNVLQESLSHYRC